MTTENMFYFVSMTFIKSVAQLNVRDSIWKSKTRSKCNVLV